VHFILKLDTANPETRRLRPQHEVFDSLLDGDLLDPIKVADHVQHRRTTTDPTTGAACRQRASRPLLEKLDLGSHTSKRTIAAGSNYDRIR
jgi:hypothetical protein